MIGIPMAVVGMAVAAGLLVSFVVIRLVIRRGDYEAGEVVMLRTPKIPGSAWLG